MINKVISNLIIIIIILTMYGWFLLATCATNSLQSISRAKLLSDKIHKTAPKEFLRNNSSNVLGNLLNRDKNTALLNYSTPTAFNTTSWQISHTILKELEIVGNDVVQDENVKINNDFHYGINKTNQENNSNNNQKQPTSSLSNNKFVNTSTLLLSSSSPRATASATGSTYSLSTASSYFERAEMYETLTHTKNEKLLLHRNKRYLLFPEGSSFQLVFDLIIPIVDYTNFAIMGITCAVAWELPSKPPSEIIENFRTKLNDGTFGLSRRNDSVQQPLEYINSLRTQQAHERNQHYLPPYQQHQQLSATIATTSGHKNYLTYGPKPLLPPPSNFYYNNYMQREKIQQPSANSTKFFYAQHPQQQQWHNYNTETFDNNQRQTLYANNNRKGPTYLNDFASQANERVYYKDHQHPATKWNADNWQQKMHQQPQQMKIHYSQMGEYGNKDNWWERNKNRIEKHWQKNKPKWTQYPVNLPMNYQAPLFSKRTSRNRKILNKRPKHLIYPIFGKRRRRRSSDGHNTHFLNDDFSKKLEDIHTREHLHTRQKLYGKIEKLYETRGQNGTACVLRALCETERMHLNAHYNETPQSFVMELLRSIFALPKDTLTNSKESLLHLDGRYANAVMLAHDVAQSCSRKYYDCEYSITYDT